MAQSWGKMRPYLLISDKYKQVKLTNTFDLIKKKHCVRIDENGKHLGTYALGTYEIFKIKLPGYESFHMGLKKFLAESMQKNYQICE